MASVGDKPACVEETSFMHVDFPSAISIAFLQFWTLAHHDVFSNARISLARYRKLIGEKESKKDTTKGKKTKP